MLDAVGHFNAGGERRGQFQPVKQFRRRAESPVQRIKEMFAATALQSSARQPSYIGDRFAAQSREPVSERSNLRHRQQWQCG